MGIRQENRKKNIRGLLLTVMAVIVLTAVGFVIVATQNSAAFKERAENYYYSASDDTVFSKVGNGLAVASTSELQVFGADGVQTMQETYIMSKPAMSCCCRRCGSPAAGACRRGAAADRTSTRP